MILTTPCISIQNETANRLMPISIHLAQGLLVFDVQIKKFFIHQLIRKDSDVNISSFTYIRFFRLLVIS